MTLVAPLAAILGAGIAVPAIIAMYLLRLRRKPVRVSSVMLWSAAAEDLEANVPLRWLRRSWLLLLHLLAALLLAGAIGRPVLSAETHSASRIVIVIDRSASMSAPDSPGGITRLDQAKRMAADLVRNAPAVAGRVRVAVISFAADALTETPFTADRSLAADVIKAIAPTDQPGSLKAVLNLIEGITGARAEGESESMGDRPLVVIYSDGGFEYPEALTLAGADLRFMRVGPDPLAALPFAEQGGGAAPEPTANLFDNRGVVTLSARRDFEDPGIVRLFARIQNAATRAHTSSLSLALNGVEVERRAISVPPTVALASPASGAAPALRPGDTTTTFEFRAPEGGLATLRLDDTDLLSADNEASIVLRPINPPSVLLVAPDQRVVRDPDAAVPDASTTADSSSMRQGPPALTPAWLLWNVLGEMRLRSLRIVDQSQAGALIASGAYDLVIFDRVAPTGLPRVSTLVFAAPQGAKGGFSAPTYILTWNRRHPVMRDVALGAVYVTGAVTASADLGVDQTELAAGNGGPLIIASESSGIRRINVNFDLSQSNWAVQTSFPIFLANAIDWLTLRGNEAAGEAFSTAQPVTIQAPASWPAATLTSPTGVASQIALSPAPTGGGVGEPGTRPLSLGMLDIAGLYTVQHQSARQSIPVNLLDANESLLATSDELRIGIRGVAAAAAAKTPRELWHWFVIGAAALLAVEWIVFTVKARA